ncbi:hypothetical protein [Aquisalimonas sp.]|nr:hypothetical protein [Aquisalimonas sp.]
MDARGIKETVERLRELQGEHGERFVPAPALERMASNGEAFHTD